jgi:hypothetical protein
MLISKAGLKKIGKPVMDRVRIKLGCLSQLQNGSVEA